MVQFYLDDSLVFLDVTKVQHGLAERCINNNDPDSDRVVLRGFSEVTVAKFLFEALFKKRASHQRVL
jgi:hypothetical protein